VLLQTEEEDDTTGLGIWCASIILARWCADANSSALPLLRGVNAIELGSGVGVSGLAAALYAEPKRLILTDLHAKTVRFKQETT
jgi:methylase of polypeptide subunit release factors